MPTSERIRRRTAGARGFTLMEVMAAVMLVAIALTVLMDLRNKAVGRAADGRSMALAARLASQLMHRIEAARVQDVYDGMVGDFSDDGYADFTWTIALGEGSAYAQDDQLDPNSPEAAWRDALEERAEDREEEDGDDVRPEKTRVIIRVDYPGFDLKPRDYRLEAMLPSWAVYQDFELYEELWGSNNELPGEIR